MIDRVIVYNGTDLLVIKAGVFTIITETDTGVIVHYSQERTKVKYPWHKVEALFYKC